MTTCRGVFRKCGWIVGAASLFWFGANSRAAEKLDSPAKVAEWIRSAAASGEVADLEATVDGSALVAPEFRRISGQLLQELLTSDKGVHLHGVRITGAVITDKFDLRNAAIPNDTRLEGCCFKGEVDLSGSHFAKGLALPGCHFERSVSGLALQVDWSVDLSSTKLFAAGAVPEIPLTNGRAVSEKLRALFAAHGAKIGGGTDFGGARFSGPANFILVSMGGNFDASSAEFTNQQDFQNDPNAPYSADVYDRLEDFFQRDGESALADDVGVEKKRQERKRVFWPALWDNFPHGVISWFKSLMLDRLVCYGRRAWQALIPSAFFIALGCWAFRFENMTRESKRREEPTPTQIWEKWPAKQPPPRLVLARWSRSVLKPLRSRSPNYHAFWYSLDQFVPLVDLKASDEWSPDPLHRFAWHYLVVHKIAGAILIPIALAALGGIVK